ncbi:MAG: hypothetical protein ACKVQC_04360 [Elusimicrobiota bacterium]
MIILKVVIMFLIKSVLNPFIFLIASASIPHHQTLFPKVPNETNVYTVNLLRYILFSTVVYALWLGITMILKKFVGSPLSIFSQINWFVWWAMIPYIFGAINLGLWMYKMEFNAFMFLLALPLLLCSIVLLVSYIKMIII